MLLCRLLPLLLRYVTLNTEAAAGVAACAVITGVCSGKASASR